MNIIFNEVYVKNFLSFGEEHIVLNDNGYTLVSGINNNPKDGARSNGSGKSSIWEAISWCLTGETIRGSKDIVNKFSDDGAVVKLNILVDGNEYTILRSKDSKEYKTNLKLTVNGQDKSGKGIRDTEKILSDYLPDITPSLLGSVIILGQGLPARFSNNTPSGRKEVLEKLSKSDFMIEELKQRISDRKSLLQADLRRVEDSALTIRTKQDMYNQQIARARGELESLSSCEGICSSLIENREMKEKLGDTLSQYKGTLLKISEYLDSMNEKKLHIVSSQKTEEAAIRERYLDIDTLVKQQYAIEADIKIVKSELDKLKNVTDTCPTCGQKLQGVEKPDTTPLLQKLTSLQQDRDKVTDRLNSLIEQRDSEIKVIENKISVELSSLNDDISAVSSEKRVLSQNIIDTESKIDYYSKTINALEKQRDDYDVKQQSLKQVIETSEQGLLTLSEELLYVNKEQESISAKLAVISKFSTIVSREFRGYLLTNVIEYINSKSKEYCSDVFNTTDINFSLEGNNISISYSGKEYENLSGGERQKVDLIVQFALRDMLCNYLNFSSNILILDEIFDNLDQEGCSSIINLISTKLKDINSIYIVTHHTDISIPYDKEIVVIKDATGVSRIK